MPHLRLGLLRRRAVYQAAHRVLHLEPHRQHATKVGGAACCGGSAVGPGGAPAAGKVQRSGEDGAERGVLRVLEQLVAQDGRRPASQW